MRKEDIEREESEYLEKSLISIQNFIKENEQKLDEQKHTIIGVKEAQRGAHFTREALMSLYATNAERLKRAKTNPYFGRFDFTQKGTNQPKKIYVGRTAVKDNYGSDLVYDWRCPVCSLYYEDGFGEKSYEAPAGKIAGDVSLKRQIKIENEKLKSVVESSSLSSDEFLIPFLKSNADSRLKDIVSSIQSEQNVIIRDKLKDNIIVQGVAGSGKTTVALHRIAYLLYTYRSIKDNQVLIIGPNDCFMDYISDVLPDLDVEKITQKTFMNIVEEIINSKMSLEDQNITIENVMKNKINVENSKFKSSLKYEKLLDEFLKNYFDNLYTNDMELDGIPLLKKERVNSFFKSGGDDVSIYDRMKYLANITIKSIKEEKADKKYLIWCKYRDEYKALDKSDPKRKEILNHVDKLESEIDKGCANLVNEYLKLKELNPLNVYKCFLEYLNSMSDEKLKELSSDTLEYVKKKKIRYEDLAAILLISMKLYDVRDFSNYAHVVIDEAQDYGLFQYDVLKRIFKNSTFSIFGDLNQSIYSYCSIDNWGEVYNKIFHGECKYGELNKSYRTTKEIIDLSNYILSQLETQNALAVLRHGDMPKFVDSEKNISNKISQNIDTLLKEGNKSIAIITKNEKEAKTLYKNLKNTIQDINIITSKDTKYNGGVCIVPSYLSKGLEFDAVIIANASEKEYSSNSTVDMKLLYVASTRPLHKLIIYHDGELTKPFVKYKNDCKI